MSHWLKQSYKRLGLALKRSKVSKSIAKKISLETPFENLKRSRSSTTDGKLFQSLDPALEKAVSPNVEWVLGATSCSSAAEGRDLAGCTAVQGQTCSSVLDRKVHGRHGEEVCTQYAVMASQCTCKCLRTGIMCIFYTCIKFQNNE